VNLSKRLFSNEEISILKLDPKFQVVSRSMSSEKIIANIENKLSSLIDDKPTLERVRVDLINCLQNKKVIEPNITKNQSRSIKNLKSYSDIIITKSDKGNKTVILNKIDYNNKIYDILNDQSVNKKINSDNSKIIANKLIKYLKHY
jgi:hypothetical protein